MKAKRILFGLVAVVVGHMAPAEAQADGYWHTQGTQVVDGDGKPVAMRGINAGNWLLWEGWMLDAGAARGTETRMLDNLASAMSPQGAAAFMERYQQGYITEDDVAAMKRSGFNLIRVPVDWRQLVNLPDCVACDGKGFDHLDQIVLWAARQDMHVVIDMHAVPGGQSGFLTSDPPPGGAQYWTDVSDQKILLDLWRTIAQRYATSKTVAGYDLINEPNAPSDQMLLGTYRDLIAAIRTVDPDHIIWVEGNHFAIDLKLFQQPLGGNIGYSSHVYIIGQDRRKQELQAASEAASRLDAPVWIGEFGQSSYSITHSTVEMMAAAPGVVGWAYWTWKRAASDDPAPCPLDLPAAWTDVSPWIGDRIGATKPNREQVTAGAAALLRTIDSDRCVPDPQLVSALKP